MHIRYVLIPTWFINRDKPFAHAHAFTCTHKSSFTLGIHFCAMQACPSAQTRPMSPCMPRVPYGTHVCPMQACPSAPPSARSCLPATRCASPLELIPPCPRWVSAGSPYNEERPFFKTHFICCRSLSGVPPLGRTFMRVV